MATSPQKKVYDESALKALTSVQAVRAKAGMYIGPTDAAGVFTICREALDNVVDEALGGHATKATFMIAEDGSYYVHDDGRGMPTGLMEVTDSISGNKYKLPGLQVITSVLHAGGKLDKDSAYEVSRGCFTGDTKIRLLSGKTVTLEKLYERWCNNPQPIPLMTYNKVTGKCVPSQISHVQLTKRTRNLVEVTLDDDSTVRCTPDHVFYTRRGGAIKGVQAKNLLPGTSLVSTYYKEDRDGYQHQTEQGKWFHIHRRVGQHYHEYELRPHVDEVHHKNSIRKDNRPSNLKVLTVSDHHREHSESRSKYAKVHIRVKQADLRAHNSIKFSAQNVDEDFIYQSYTQKVIRIAARAKVRFGKITSSTYSAVRRNSEITWLKALRYISKPDLVTLVDEYLLGLKSKVGRSPIAEDKLEDLHNGTGTDPVTFSKNANWQKSLKVWREHLETFDDISEVTPHEFNRRPKTSAVIYGRYAQLYRYTTLTKFKRHLLSGGPLVLHEDQSEEAQELRMMQAEIRMRAPESLRKMVAYFVSSLKKAKSLTEEAYSLVKASCAPQWKFGLAIIEYEHGITFEGLEDFVNNFNHRITGVRPYKVNQAVSVYDLTVDGQHCFFVEPGVLVSNSHGIGIKATNFLSTFFNVTTFYKGAWWTIGFKQGKLTQELKKLSGATYPSPFSNKPLTKGTLVHFKPDPSIFSAKSFPGTFIFEWANMACYFTPSFTVEIQHHSGKNKTICHPGGPKQFVVDQVAKTQSKPIDPAVFHFTNVLMDVVLQFTNYDGCGMQAFTNGLSNPERGVHFNALFSAMFAALEPFVKKRQEFTLNELKDGVLGVINVKMSSPRFASQTKEKLVDERGDGPVKETLLAEFTTFFKKNKALTEALCQRCFDLKQLKTQFKASKDVIGKLRKASQGGMKHNAALSPNCTPAERELFILEGESAAGGCFIGSTIVQTERGPQSLSYLHENALEWQGPFLDFDTNKIMTGTFSVPIITKETCDLVEVELDDGTVITCTPDHLFLTDDGLYTKAEDLDGKKVVSHNGY